MTILTIDTETTTSNKGNPFDTTNKLVCISVAHHDAPAFCFFNKDDFLYNLYEYDLIVMFNAKFDLHWLKKSGVSVDGITVWDCQLAEYMLERQTLKYPSLEQAAIKYGLGHKIDVIKNEYWDKGIDTDQIPILTLAEYANQDVELTYQIYLKQLEQFEQQPKLFKLFKLACMDLLVLQEMEWSGLLYDQEVCQKASDDIKARMDEITKELSSIHPDVPINWNSNDHVSAFLYGGIIKEEAKEHVGFYKTGAKAGQMKYKNVEKQHQLPQIYKPLKGSELKKEGMYSTNEDTLRKLKGPKKYIDLLLEHAKLEKLNGTYYNGYQEMNRKMQWPVNYLHGQYNQCVTATGRLSSSRPNLQNIAGDVKRIFITRY